jgi:hypothetical protein
MLLDDMCAICRNYFTDDSAKHKGTFSVKDGVLSPLDYLAEGQYFRVVGSVFNDGVHQYPAPDLTDEVFDGEVWAMRLPPAFLALAGEIDEYSQKMEGCSAAPYTSESFGGDSYEKATDAETGAPLSWQAVFASKLNRWRKI